MAECVCMCVIYATIDDCTTSRSSSSLICENCERNAMVEKGQKCEKEQKRLNQEIINLKVKGKICEIVKFRQIEKRWKISIGDCVWMAGWMGREFRVFCENCRKKRRSAKKGKKEKKRRFLSTPLSFARPSSRPADKEMREIWKNRQLIPRVTQKISAKNKI